MKRAFFLVIGGVLLASFAEGQQMRSGAGVPVATIGNNGDVYHRTDMSAIYGPKINGSWPSAYSYTLGIGCTTAYHIDKDCDGYGLGPTSGTPDPNPVFGPDGDDNDAAVSTPTSVIAKWGSMSAFLTHLGYPTSRIYYIDPTSGNDSTGNGSAGNPYQHYDAIGATLHDNNGGTVIYRASLTAGLGICGYGGPCYNPKATSASSPLVIMAYPGESVIFYSTGPLGADSTYGFSNNVVYDGFILRSSNQGLGHALNGNNVINLTLRNSEVSGFDIAWEMGGGAQNPLIEGNVFHDIHEHAIYPTSAGVYSAGLFNCPAWTWDTGQYANNPFFNMVVRNNLFYNSGVGGYEPIHLNAIICGATVSGNIVWNSGGTGLGLQTGVQNATVANNLIFSNSSAAITLSVYGCDNNGSPTTAIQASTVCSGYTGEVTYYPNMLNNITIINNTLWTGRDAPPGSSTVPSYGILINDYSAPAPDNRYIKNVTIKNNLILTYNDGSSSGFPSLYYSTNSYPETNTIQNNMLYNLYPGNSSSNVMHIIGVSDCTGVGSPFGGCTGPKTGTVNSGSAYPGSYSFAQFQNYNSGNNSGNLFGDPLFVDVQLGYDTAPNLFNFHLQGTSGAIGAGTSTGAPATDLAGLARPNPPSIGAYEFTPTSVPTGATTQLTLVSGNNQSGTTGQQLGSPLVIMATNSNGSPIPGVPVTFAITAGGGMLSSSQVTTNASGQASTSLTLGASAATNVVTVTSNGVVSSPIMFTATASAGITQAAKLVVTGGNGQSAAAGQPLPSPFVVTITDVNGNPIPGVQVTFAVASGGGSLSATQLTTNASGQASSVLTVGQVSGSNVVMANSGGLTGSPATFTAMATASGGATWVKSPWTLLPFFRGFNRLVYDPVLHRTLVGASENATTIYSDSYWAYDSAAHTWTQMTTTGEAAQCVSPLGSNPPAHPANRHPYHGLAYDTTRGQMYLFSGVCQGYQFSDMWAYKSSQNAWTQLSPATNPGARLEGAMTYDSAHDVVVLYGGLAPNPSADTWQYAPASNTWLQVGSNGAPGTIAGHSMVYDSINQKVVLFGGYTNYGGPGLNGTWIYDAGTKTWTNPNPSVKPPGAYYPAMAFDSKRGLVVLYEGTSAMWGYNVATNQWIQLPVSGGPAPVDTGGSNCFQCLTLAYDEGTDKYILTNEDDSYSTGTWELSLGNAGSSSHSYDLNGDGAVDLLDLQLAILQALGSSPCSSADFSQDGQCTGVDVKMIINYILSH